MKLQKFKEEKKNQKVIILFTITCVLLITGVFLYKTFATFQVVENEDLINGDVSDPGDIYFVFYKDNQLTKEMPQKGTGYAYDYEKSHCEVPGKEESKAIPYFDSIDWSITVREMTERPTKCTIYFYQGYQEDILKGTDPVLERPLIPVHIDEKGKVTKADPGKEWYNYERKEWANAVILVDETKQYEIDQEIEEKDIESYFVWIPRYRYQLKESEATFNSYNSLMNEETYMLQNVEEFYQKILGGNKGKNETFEIEFENITETPSNDNTQYGWLTHPAFTAFNSNGFWVGKFETGYNQNSDTNLPIADTSSWTKVNAENTSNTNKEEPTKVIIKPNVYSWRNINVSNAFYTSYNYKRELESHMMKNTEWGAVAYLTQSKYGRCNGSTCEEVRINNNSNYITGYSAKSAPTVGYGAYNDLENTSLNQDGDNGYHYGSGNASKQESSTTGNYTGIYDMSGGSWDYVMGVMQATQNNKVPTTGPNSTQNSGFNGPYSNDSNNGSKTDGKPWPSSKYYDLYEYHASNQEYQRGTLGDATKEMGPFYKVSYNNGSTIRHIGSYNADLADFVNSVGAWFIRGAAYSRGTDTGVGSFGAGLGNESSEHSFRVILTP